jgi:hypothetical protein
MTRNDLAVPATLAVLLMCGLGRVDRAMERSMSDRSHQSGRIAVAGP